MEAKKGPDRLNYSIQAKALLDKIDELNFFGLANRGGAGVSRSEIFLFSMALGVESKSATDISNYYPGGLVRETSLDNKTKAAMYSQFIFELIEPENKLDEISKKSEVYKLAERYANAGFEYLADYIINRRGESLMLDLLKELDEQYEALFAEQLNSVELNN